MVWIVESYREHAADLDVRLFPSKKGMRHDLRALAVLDSLLDPVTSGLGVVSISLCCSHSFLSTACVSASSPF